MSAADKLNQVKKKMEAIKKDHRYKKANKDRAIQAELTYEITKCAGDLGVCQKDFKYTIEEQSYFIRKGQAEGYDTSVQEMQLEDATIGYMLVKDALFALRSVYSYDSVGHAYDLLDAATMKITGEKAFPFFDKSSKKPKREEYGFLNSQEAYEQKRAMYSSFKDKLILTGDIEECIEEAKQNRNQVIDDNINFPNNMSVEQLRSAASSIPDDVRRENRKRMLENAHINTGVPDDN